MREGFYKINVNPVKKVVNMEVGGTFTPDKAQQFVNDYHTKIGKLQANEFELHFDCKNIDVVTQDMVPHLQACYELYKQSGFKQVVVEITKSAIIKMQLTRIARTTGLTNFNVVEV